MGCDRPFFKIPAKPLLFQSTHPGWGATEDKKQKQIRRWNFNPRTPGGVRPAWAQWSSARSHFNPRTPGGVRRAFSSVGSWFSEISIHAPRVGCDIRPYGLARPSIHFNPRTPGGVRPIYDLCVSLYQLEFQSTHPGWGATRGTLAISKAGLIFQSTHPGGVGCDESDLKELSCASDFNPRTPGGVRQSVAKIKRNRALNFHPTSPWWGATRVGGATSSETTPDPHPRTPGWGATFGVLRFLSTKPIQFQCTHPGTGYRHNDSTF